MLKAADKPFEITNLALGVDWSVPIASVELPYLLNAKNVNLTGLKMPEKRYGCSKLYPTAYSANTVLSFYDYHTPLGDQYVLVQCGTSLGYYDSGWSDVKTGLTAGYRLSFAAYAGYVYCSNGQDANFKILEDTASSLGVTAPSTDPVAEAGAVQTSSQTDDYSFSVSNWWPLHSSWYHWVVGQSLVFAEPATITSIKVWLRQIGTIASGNVWAEIWSSNGDLPFEQVGVDSATVDATTVDANPGEEITFTFTGMPELEPDKMYFLLLFADYTADDTNYLDVGRDAGTNNYPPGASIRQSNRGNWTWLGTDLYMKLIYNRHSGAGLTGKYKWVYTYVNSAGSESNPSDASNVLDLMSQKGLVTVAYTVTTDIDYIRLYRTLNMDGLDPDNVHEYYRVTEIDNDTGGGTYEITDDVIDNELTDMLSYDNTVPPKATYLVTFQDRLIFANCPAEEDGGSLFMISKAGLPEACPSLNYHYFDRDDGNDITGIAALPDYLVVFKRNKIAVMDKYFSEWKTISDGIGCVQPYSIITMTDKVVFISEEGPKATDGITVFDISKKLKALQNAGWFPEGSGWTGAYYPLRHQFYWNNYSTTSHAAQGALNGKGSAMIVGHWLSSLYKEVTPEFDQQDIYVGWTWHLYESLALNAIGTYTDSNGITRIIGGSTVGVVYLLDTGYNDDSTAIVLSIQTPFVSLGIPANLTKTVRHMAISYRGSGASAVDVYMDVDFTTNSNKVDLTGGTCTFSDATYPYYNSLYSGTASYTSNETFDLDESACGELFSWRLEDAGSSGPFALCRIGVFFRIEGLR